MANDAPKVGTVGWHDLTVQDAEAVRDFYEAVIGWKAEPVDMGDYADFNMIAPETGDPVAGVCHARGENAAIPPQWMLYFIVADVGASVETCIQRGGEALVKPKETPGGRYAIIRDPAGAVCALFTPA